MPNIINHLYQALHKPLAAMTGTILVILLGSLILTQILPSQPVPKSSTAAQSADTASQTASQYSTINTGSKVTVSGETRAVWISFLEYRKKGYTKSQWQNWIDKTLNNCKAKGFNTIVMHVRPFSDAMYPSKYYPWSRYASGKAGRNPGFDPLAYAVSAAHKRGLAFHAWINPYRVTKDTTKISTLPKNSKIYKWATSKKKSKRRNVLKYNGQLYLNPASADVQKLVTNGVMEIVNRYHVDGIHFDDYFYPNLGSGYRKNFDAKEYKAYVKRCRKKGTKARSIVSWRRNNVSKLLKKIHSKIQSADPNCDFGISPAGNIKNLYAKNNYYADVKKWMASDQYIDYICPQIYWSFKQRTCPYKKTVNQWSSIARHSSVRLYIGIAGYRAGISAKEARAVSDPSWSKSNTILKRQVQYLRTKNCSGFFLFSYQDLNRTAANKEMQNLRSILN